jgi:hypothetical protein
MPCPAEDGALRLEVDRLRETIRDFIGGRPYGIDPGPCHHSVDSAKAFDPGIDRPGHGSSVGNIGLRSDCGRTNLFLQPMELFALDIDEHDGSTRRCQRSPRCCADPIGCSGDQDGASTQRHLTDSGPAAASRQWPLTGLSGRGSRLA